LRARSFLFQDAKRLAKVYFYCEPIAAAQNSPNKKLIFKDLRGDFSWFLHRKSKRLFQQGVSLFGVGII
jgi:hypothetical protein